MVKSTTIQTIAKRAAGDRKAKHSSKNAKWITPPWLIEMVREVMGNIDLDPASSDFANQYVKANRYFTEQDDGLLQDWRGGSIFINPPGGRTEADSVHGYATLPQLFWNKLMDQHLNSPSFIQAVFIVFNIEMLQTSQNKEYPSILEFPFCVPAKRVKFIDPDSGQQSRNPTHANAIVYVPGNVNNMLKFEKIFNDIGRTVIQ